MTDTRPMPPSFPLEKAGAEVSPLALLFYAIAEYSTVIDHCHALRKAGMEVPHGCIRSLEIERRDVMRSARLAMGERPWLTHQRETDMVQQAREWLAEHPEEIDRIEKGGENS